MSAAHRHDNGVPTPDNNVLTIAVTSNTSCSGSAQYLYSALNSGRKKLQPEGRVFHVQALGVDQTLVLALTSGRSCRDANRFPGLCFSCRPCFSEAVFAETLDPVDSVTPSSIDRSLSVT